MLLNHKKNNEDFKQQKTIFVGAHISTASVYKQLKNINLSNSLHVIRIKLILFF